jgi:acyl-CoA thioesterase II
VSGADHTAPPDGSPIANLVRLLDIEELDRDLYRGQNPPRRYGTLYGGQVAAQALRAAALTVPEGRSPHSFHGYFLRAGRTDHPTILRVDRDRDGRSFSSRHVVAIQHGEVIFSLSASFHVDEPGFELQAPAPDDVSTAEDHPAAGPESMDQYQLPMFEVRILAADHERGLRGEHRPLARMWIRAREPLGDDPLLHTCVLAYVSDLGSGFADVHVPDVPRGGPSLDHAVWFHRPARVDEWMLLELHPVAAAGSRGLYHGAIYDASGARCASITQELLLRRVSTDHTASPR